MKQLQKITIPSIAAVLIIVGCFAFFFLSGLGILKASENMQTQINSGLFAALMTIVGFYFGGMHAKAQLTTEDIAKPVEDAISKPQTEANE